MRAREWRREIRWLIESIDKKIKELGDMSDSSVHSDIDDAYSNGYADGELVALKKVKRKLRNLELGKPSPTAKRLNALRHKRRCGHSP